MRIIEIFICRLDEFSRPGAIDPGAFLAPDERQRFERFAFDRHRLAFLASRKLLKTALAQKLNCAVTQLAFMQGPQGKPSLLPVLNPAGWEFNLTHSDNWALVALDVTPIGIDTENLQRRSDIVNIARHNFHPLEIDFLSSKSDQPQWGFYYWMLKEAYIKFLGTGLSQSLKEFYFDWGESLVFGAEKPMPIPLAAVLQWQSDGVAAVCCKPGPIKFCLFELQHSGEFLPVEHSVLAQTAHN